MIRRATYMKTFGWLASASFLMFVSSNFVNFGNLLFNLLFSRWMGPELFSDLAFLLTLKLSILSVLNAVQFLVTEKVAHANQDEIPHFIKLYARISKSTALLIFFAVPVIAAVAIHFHWASHIGLQSEISLLVFFLGFPFYLPLALWRGVAQGRIDIWRIIGSANAEMLVRLLGGAAFWWMGFGISSVIFAFVLSLAAAWWFARPTPVAKETQAASRPTALPLSQAWPWAAIQLASVLALDGDVFATKLIMSANDAGLIAAISLVQRIIFYASFSLAAILLPQVVQSVKDGKLGIRESIPIFALIAVASLPICAALKIFPQPIVSVLFGNEFMSIQNLLFPAAISATLITLNYFIAIFMMAHKFRPISFTLLALSIAQIVYLSLLIRYSDASLSMVVAQKLNFQMISFVIILILAMTKLRSRNISNKGI